MRGVTLHVCPSCFSKKELQVRVGFCGLSSVRPLPSDVTPEHEVAYLNSFSQDNGFWDSLEHGFMNEREGQITADTCLAFSDPEATGMVVLRYHSYFLPSGGREGSCHPFSGHRVVVSHSQWVHSHVLSDRQRKLKTRS